MFEGESRNNEGGFRSSRTRAILEVGGGEVWRRVGRKD